MGAAVFQTALVFLLQRKRLTYVNTVCLIHTEERRRRDSSAKRENCCHTSGKQRLESITGGSYFILSLVGYTG